MPGKHVLEFELADKNSRIDLPIAFEGNEMRQFRIVSKGGRSIAYLDGIAVAELTADIKVTDAAVFIDSEAIIDMIRVTEI